MTTFDIFTALLVFVSFLCMFWGPGGLLRRKESQKENWRIVPDAYGTYTIEQRVKGVYHYKAALIEKEDAAKAIANLKREPIYFEY